MTSPPRAIIVVIRPGAMVVAWFVRRAPRQSGPLLGSMERGPHPGTPAVLRMGRRRCGGPSDAEPRELGRF